MILTTTRKNKRLGGYGDECVEGFDGGLRLGLDMGLEMDVGLVLGNMIGVGALLGVVLGVVQLELEPKRNNNHYAAL
jgi:hypothetical protein